MGDKRKHLGDKRFPGKNGSKGNGSNMRGAYEDDDNTLKSVDKDSPNSCLDLLGNPSQDLPLPMSKRGPRLPGDSGDKSSSKNVNSEGYSTTIHLHGDTSFLLRSKRENDTESPGYLDNEFCWKDVIKEGMEVENIYMESMEPEAIRSAYLKSGMSLTDITEGQLPNPSPNGPRAPPPPDHLDQ